MQIPINCPKCNDPLLNIFNLTFLFKKCDKYLDHKFCCWAVKNAEQLFSAAIQIHLNYWVFWDFIPKKMKLYPGPDHFHKGYFEDIYLPYFEPDFSNYDQLINKIKTYSMLI